MTIMVISAFIVLCAQHTHTYTNTQTHTYMHTHTLAQTYTRTRIYTHTQTHTYMQTHTNTHTHTIHVHTEATNERIIIVTQHNRSLQKNANVFHNCHIADLTRAPGQLVTTPSYSNPKESHPQRVTALGMESYRPCCRLNASGEGHGDTARHSGRQSAFSMHKLMQSVCENRCCQKLCADTGHIKPRQQTREKGKGW